MCTKYCILYVSGPFSENVNLKMEHKSKPSEGLGNIQWKHPDTLPCPKPDTTLCKKDGAVYEYITRGTRRIVANSCLEKKALLFCFAWLICTVHYRGTFEAAVMGWI